MEVAEGELVGDEEGLQRVVERVRVVEGEVVVLKMNPVNEYLGPFMDEAFRELVRLGYFRVVYGGAKEGDYLCTHELVGSIHITGSDKTFDAIVWGTGAEAAGRKRRGEPRNDKPISSELGNVSPIIVVPGPWTDEEIEFQATNIASSLTNNAGFNCNATRVIVTQSSWAKRGKFIDAAGRPVDEQGILLVTVEPVVGDRAPGHHDAGP